MLPPNLVSTYQGYKHDTNSIAAWLASTAKSCGYTFDAVTTGPPKPGTSTRLKGKVRAEAKKKEAEEKEKDAAAKSAPGAKYTIKIQDFVPMAEFIASQRKISVPASLITTLQRVINVRKGFGGRLTKSGAVKDELEDQKHGYFVEILGKVREILLPRAKTPAAASASRDADADKKAEATGSDGLINQFAALKMYEPSDDFMNAPDIERPQPSGATNVAYEAESLGTFEDAIIAMGLLNIDLRRIRSRIRWIWSTWRDRSLDLAAAAIATNTAIDLARNLIDDAMPLIDSGGGLDKILSAFLVLLADHLGYETPVPFNAAKLACEAFDIGDQTYFLTFLALQELRSVVKAGVIPIYREGSFGYYDPQSDRTSKSGEKKFEEDKVLLMKFSLELITVERGIPDYPVTDEFLRGVKKLAETKQVSFSLVFAAQIFLDIHHILRPTVNQGFDILEKNLLFFETEMAELLKYHQDIKSVKLSANHDTIITNLKANLRWVLDDAVYDVKRKVCQRMHQILPSSVERNRILKMSPVLSGLMLYSFRVQIWSLGIELANEWGSITYSLHLYNALQAEGLDPGPWPDMDVVRTILGDSNFFVGDPPKTPADYAKKLSLQAGMTAVAFTQNRRANIPRLTSQAGPRVIKEGIHVSRMFMDRYVANTGQVDLTAEDVAKIIELSLFEIEGSEEDDVSIISQIVDPEKLQQKKNRSKRSRRTAKLRPERLIRGLMFALEAESLELAFPYTAMHRQGLSLLRAVREHCDSLLQKTFAPAIITQGSALWYVVTWIFANAQTTKDSKLLLEAGVAVREFLRSEGGWVLGLLKGIDKECNMK